MDHSFFRLPTSQLRARSFRCGLLFGVAAVFLGSGRQNASAAEPSGAEPSAGITNESQLRALAIPGLSTNEVLERFGKPMDTFERSKEDVMWRYRVHPFPAEGAMQGTYVIDFGLEMTNGRLSHLDLSYVEPPRTTLTRTRLGVNLESRKRDHSGRRLPLLSFYIVSDHPVAGGQFVDTTRFPKLGFVPHVPSLSAYTLEEVTLKQQTEPGGEGTNRTVWVFGISLTRNDASRFEALTTKNQSKRMLIMVGNEPVWAPMLLMPIPGGSFDIDCKDRGLMEFLREEFQQAASTGQGK